MAIAVVEYLLGEPSENKPAGIKTQRGRLEPDEVAVKVDFGRPGSLSRQKGEK